MPDIITGTRTGDVGILRFSTASTIQDLRFNRLAYVEAFRLDCQRAVV